jgi:hypothetical protein
MTFCKAPSNFHIVSHKSSDLRLMKTKFMSFELKSCANLHGG